LPLQWPWAAMSELPALRLCLKNTFLDVVCDDSEQHRQGEKSVATVGMLEGSPRAARSRSAGCSPRNLEESWARPLTSPQLERLNDLLSSCAERRHESDEISSISCTQCEEAAVSSVSSEISSPFLRPSSLPDSCSTAASEPKEYCHKFIPRREDLRSNDADANQPTTLMIRNIPNCYVLEDLLGELEQLGFGGNYDFACLPMDKCSKASVGYAFVNFVSSSWASSFVAGSRGHFFTRRGKSKEVVVSVAHLQGLAANLEHYDRARKSSKMALQRPFVLADSPNVVVFCD